MNSSGFDLTEVCFHEPLGDELGHLFSSPPRRAPASPLPFSALFPVTHSSLEVTDPQDCAFADSFFNLDDVKLLPERPIPITLPMPNPSASTSTSSSSTSTVSMSTPSPILRPAQRPRRAREARLPPSYRQLPNLDPMSRNLGVLPWLPKLEAAIARFVAITTREQIAAREADQGLCKSVAQLFFSDIPTVEDLTLMLYHAMFTSCNVRAKPKMRHSFLAKNKIPKMEGHAIQRFVDAATAVTIEGHPERRTNRIRLDCGPEYTQAALVAREQCRAYILFPVLVLPSQLPAGVVTALTASSDMFVGEYYDGVAPTRPFAVIDQGDRRTTYLFNRLESRLYYHLRNWRLYRVPAELNSPTPSMASTYSPNEIGNLPRPYDGVIISSIFPDDIQLRFTDQDRKDNVKRRKKNTLH